MASLQGTVSDDKNSNGPMNSFGDGNILIYATIIMVNRNKRGKGQAMKSVKKTLNATLVMLLVGVVISSGGWAFAQEDGTSGSVKDLSHNQSSQGAFVTAQDAGTGALAETGHRDASGKDAVSIPFLRNSTLLASKFGYDRITSPDVFELSDLTPNRTENTSTDEKSWLKEKPPEPTRVLNWETGAN